MYIEKRWLIPATLTLMLGGTLFAVVLLALGSSLGESRSVSSTASGAPKVLWAAPSPDPAAVAPVTGAGPAVAGPVAPAASAPEEVVDISTRRSENTQITTRGFGDVGMQFQNVNLKGRITVVHISNEGNNNSNNVNIGHGNGIVSDQQDLQSNRSDASPPVAAAPLVTAAPAPAAASPTGPPARAHQADQGAQAGHAGRHGRSRH